MLMETSISLSLILCRHVVTTKTQILNISIFFIHNKYTMHIHTYSVLNIRISPKQCFLNEFEIS